MFRSVDTAYAGFPLREYQKNRYGIYKGTLCLLFLLFLSSCASNHSMAPVSELHWHPFAQFQKSHQVKKGETLYSISFKYDVDYRQLAALNHLRPPYLVKIGQVLNLHGIARRPAVRRPSRADIKPKRIINTPSSRVIYSPRWPSQRFSNWLWPASGQVVTAFMPQQGKKGINIACKKGEKIKASAAGIVAYAGSGLRGYGNLIIIKHNNEFLTAYGNNAKNLVVEGQAVKAGQIIARVGVVDHKYIGVHFEIRKKGEPVNPLNYLEKG